MIHLYAVLGSIIVIAVAAVVLDVPPSFGIGVFVFAVTVVLAALIIIAAARSDRS